MIVASPSRLAADAELLAVLRPLLPPDRLEAYARATGVELRTLPEALVAGFDFSTLYLARGADASLVRRRFEERLLSGAVERVPRPGIEVVSGVIGRTPQTLVVVEHRLIGVAVGDPTPARVVQAFAERKLQRSPSALRGSALSTLPRGFGDAPVCFYAPGPFSDEWAQGARGLLALAFAAGVAVRPLPGKRVEATLALAGDYSGVSDAVERLRGSWTALAESSTGKLVGLHRPAAEPTVSESDAGLLLRVTLELEPIVRGLRAAVMSDVWEMLELSPAGPAP
jgi:hypothetical protein